jgi:hypothetical protein
VIRRLYPPTSRCARRGVRDFYGRGRLPPFPTDALPGTPEKIAVLAWRASEGLALWHPDDALLDRRLLPLLAG